jgi:putative heme-binding domain-containing protein
MTADGLSFTSRRLDDEQQSEFLASTDNWFRPTQIKTGPDGALWIADMYRLVIEHPQWIPQEWQEKLNVRAGEDKGRIWRVYPANRKPRAIPRLDKLTTEELVAALDSPSGWQRDMAQQLLIEKKDLAAISPLKYLVLECERPQARLHAICVLVALDEIDGDFLERALHDEDSMVRRQILSQSSALGWKSRQWFRSKSVVPLVDDSDRAVRLQLALEMGSLPSDVADMLGELARNNQGERFVIAAVFSSLNQQNVAGFLDAIAREAPGDSLRDDFVAELIAQLVAFDRPAGLTPLIAPVVARPLSKWSDRDWHLVDRFMTSMAKSGHSWKKWNEQSEPPITWTAALQERLSEAVRIAQDENAPSDRRVAALRLSRYAEWKGDALSAAMRQWLQPTQPPEVQLAAVEMFRTCGDAAVTYTLIGRWRELTPNTRAAARDALLARTSGCQALLEFVQKGELAAVDFDAITRQRLLDHNDKAIRQRAEQLLGSITSQARAEVITRYQPVARSGGDAQRGGELFRKTCAQCHKLGDAGFAVGPDLRSLTDKSPEAMLAAILDPNRAVETKYLTYTAVTSQGQSFTGLLETETATSITLLAAEGKQHALLRNDLDELAASNKSLMPEGLEKDITPEMMADLIAFVRANVPLPKRKEFPGNTPRVVTASDGRLTLLPADAEIYGSTIVLEPKHANLGWWSSADDLAVWTVSAPRSGRYAVTIDYACDLHAAGHRLVIDGGKRPLTHRVEATANWDAYRSVTIGELELEAGVQRLTFRPASRPLPALMDLKSATLTFRPE